MTDAKRRDRAFYSKLNAKNLLNHERLTERSRVMYNTALSAQARLLYYLIDDLGGSGAGMWWGWRKMALRLGLSRPSFFRLVAELRDAGAITTERRGNRLLYLTKRVSEMRPPQEEWSQKQDSAVSEMRLSDDSSINESVQFESGAAAPLASPTKCKTCSDTGLLPGYSNLECQDCSVAADRHRAEVAAWKRGERPSYPERGR